MYSEFAYSGVMQVILAVMTFFFTFTFIYLIAILILEIFGERAGRGQKAIFALLVGGLLNTVWTYAIYFIGGKHPFSSTVYALVVNPNPVFALLYLVIGIKVLKLPPVRSVKVMGHVYLYYVSIQIFNRILNTIFFVQTTDRYNFMLDAISQITLFCVVWVIFFATRYIIRRYSYTINLNLFIDFKRELVSYCLKAVLIYLMLVGLPLFISNQIVANIVILTVFVLIFLLTNIWEQYNSVVNEVGYRDGYISFLSSNNAADCEEDSSLHKKMAENPSLISILIGKRAVAEKKNVCLCYKLQSSINDFYIDNTDICVIVDCLLENAIEAASASKSKKVVFTLCSMSYGEKLIVINSSTAVPVETGKLTMRDITAARERKGKGFAVVRRIVSMYGNCTFQLSYHNYEVSTYLETKMLAMDFS